MSYFLPAFKNKYYCTYKIHFLAVGQSWSLKLSKLYKKEK